MSKNNYRTHNHAINNDADDDFLLEKSLEVAQTPLDSPQDLLNTKQNKIKAFFTQKTATFKAFFDKRNRKKSIRQATFFTATYAVLLALSTVLMIFEFPIFPLAPHYKLGFSQTTLLLATFMLGTIPGCTMSMLTVALKILIVQTRSGYIGDISNLVGNLSLLIPAGLIFFRKKTLPFAIIASSIGMVCLCIVMMFFNIFALLPMFSGFMPALESSNFRVIYAFTWCLPFNIIKSVVNAAAAILLYKYCETTIKHVMKIINAKSKTQKETSTTTP